MKPTLILLTLTLLASTVSADELPYRPPSGAPAPKNGKQPASPPPSVGVLEEEIRYHALQSSLAQLQNREADMKAEVTAMVDKQFKLSSLYLSSISRRTFLEVRLAGILGSNISKGIDVKSAPQATQLATEGIFDLEVLQTSQNQRLIEQNEKLTAQNDQIIALLKQIAAKR